MVVDQVQYSLIEGQEKKERGEKRERGGSLGRNEMSDSTCDASQSIYS